MIESVVVFCGSKAGLNPLFAHHAAELGKLIAVLDLKLVYGGGKVGLMGIIADSVLAHGGRVMGVIPKVLTEWEHQHEGLTELAIVPDMHTRKKMMYDMCDAAIVMPGGFGTLDELAEVLTLIQTKKSRHVPIILVGAEFWKGLLAWFESALVPMGLINPEDMNLMQVIDDPDQVLEAVLAFYEDREETEPQTPAKSDEDRMFYL